MLFVLGLSVNTYHAHFGKTKAERLREVCSGAVAGAGGASVVEGAVCERLPQDFRDPTAADGRTLNLRRDLLRQGGYDPRTPAERAQSEALAVEQLDSGGSSPVPQAGAGLSPDMFASLLKNTIDWVSRPLPGEKPLACYTGKVAGLVAASPGALRSRTVRMAAQ